MRYCPISARHLKLPNHIQRIGISKKNILLKRSPDGAVNWNSYQQINLHNFSIKCLFDRMIWIFRIKIIIIPSLPFLIYKSATYFQLLKHLNFSTWYHIECGSQWNPKFRQKTIDKIDRTCSQLQPHCIPVNERNSGRLKLHHSSEKSIQSSFPNYYPTTMAAVGKLSGAISSKW